MPTRSAARARASREPWENAVVSVRELIEQGWTADRIRNQIRARRWQRIGRAVIRHNAEPTGADLRRAAVIVLGPRAVRTAFTALDEWGLTGWPRPDIHVLVPRGARVTRPPQLRRRVHYTDAWSPVAIAPGRALHLPVHAGVLAASTLRNPRSACAILAATVQQRLVRPDELIETVTAATRIRHRAVLLAAARDIAQGAEALSEIDFARLCRRHGLPEPLRQAVRRDPFGRRRYLDAEWKRRDGRRVVAEVDGALHLIASRSWDDQVRQNELVIADDLVLRFPSVVLYSEEPVVVGQLRRALLL